MKSIEDFSIGQVAEFQHEITARDVARFVELTGDDNPLHVDSQYAERTVYKGVVTHGMLSAAFISTLIGKHIPGDGALWVSQSLEFLLPVRIGDRLTVRAEVLAIHASQRLLDLRATIANQHGQTVLQGTARVRLLELEQSAEVAPAAATPRVALVTGASRGIGAAIALRLARDRFAVAVNYRSDSAGAQDVVSRIVAEGGEAIAVKADVVDSVEVDAMLRTIRERYGDVTALVNNATGSLVTKKFQDVGPDEIERYFRVQFHAPLDLIRRLLPGFERAGGGSVVNISSVNCEGVPAPRMLAYTASKAALASATRSLAVEFGPHGFRFNVVAPGMTETRLIADVPEKTRVLTRAQTPLRRLARPDDVAHAVAWLVSDEARHMTGQTLHVCGGSVMP